ncbi:MAG TPA: hypothetical protein VG537_04740, partial [Candidatus Kapabacteria bacterium]|nr:hypothetical protein [Candidatus Kapabacteria bacterium]
VLVGGSTAANVHSAEVAANAATDANTASMIVKRDASGNFSAGTITGNLNGNATTSNTFTGSLSGDVTGTQSVTSVVLVGGSTAANVHSAEVAANAATNTNTASTIVKRDASGNFSAGTITGNLNGNATNFTGSLSGDVTGTQAATAVASVGGSTAANVHSAEVAANAATNTNTASTIVKRDASGNFSAGTITGNLTGTATNATNAASFTGSLSGDVTGTQSATLVALVGGSTAVNVHSAEVAANAATDANTASTIVKRDASGNFSAGSITAVSQLELNGTGSGVSTFQSGAQGATSINYTLPTLTPSSNQVLTATTVSGSAVTLGWAASSGGNSMLFARKTNVQDFVTTGLIVDTNLKLSLSSGSTYIFDAFLSFSDPNASGDNLSIGFNIPANSTIKFGVEDAAIAPGANPTVVSATNASSTSASTTLSIDNNGTAETLIYVKGIVITGSTSDYIQLKCARVGSSAIGIRLNTNSYITATKVQ